MNSKLLLQIIGLPPAERIKLAQDIWDSVTEIPNSNILNDWQKNELKKRRETLDQNSNLGVMWKEVISELRNVK